MTADETNEIETEGDIIEEVKEASGNSANVQKLPDVSDWCSTGIITMDLAISNRFPGGIPMGRVIHAFGGGSTAKSALLMTILGYAQRSGKQAIIADVEHTMDPHFAKIFGVDCNSDNFSVWYPETLEEMFDSFVNGAVYKNSCEKNHNKKRINDSPKVIGIDSVTALPSGSELGKPMGEGTYGLTRPKLMSEGFRKYCFPLATSNTAMFCIDQTRDNVGVLFGNKEITSGGRALEFYSSVQIYLKHDSNIVNSKGVCVGIWVKFKIVKNKVAPPFREGRFKLLFDYGIDNIATNIYFLMFHQNGEKKAKDKTSELNLFGESHKQSEWIKIIERDNLENDLNIEVYNVWQQIHKIDDRKPRVW